jgi:hypothetical protein
MREFEMNCKKDADFFKVGTHYRTINYVTDKVCEIEIVGRKGSWLTIKLDGVEKNVRTYPVSNPYSESILMNDYSPVFSYQNIKSYKEIDDE